MSKKGFTIWLTGLSGSGKTTLANVLKTNFSSFIIVDGDELRGGVCKDLGYDVSDRHNNVLRAAEICKLLNNQGHNVIACMTSPSQMSRNMASKVIGDENFFLVYLACSLKKVKERDVKGLYKKHETGAIKNMVGCDIVYEIPFCPDITVNTEVFSVADCAKMILMELLEKKKVKQFSLT